jgi:hypothetical protein
MPPEIEVDKIRLFEDEELLMSSGFIVDWFILYYQKTNNNADLFIKKVSEIYENHSGLLFFYLRNQCYFVEPNPEKFFNLLIDDLERNENRNISNQLKEKIASNKKKFFKDNPDLVQGIILE